MYLKYPALIIKIKDMFKGQYGRYIVSLIDYKECFSSASTLEEAFKNANEMLILTAWEERKTPSDVYTLDLRSTIRSFLSDANIPIECVDFKNSILTVLNINTDDYTESFKTVKNNIICEVIDKEKINNKIIRCPNCGASYDNLEIVLSSPLQFKMKLNGEILYDDFSTGYVTAENARLNIVSDSNCYCRSCGTYCIPCFDKKESPTKVVKLERVNYDE